MNGNPRLYIVFLQILILKVGHFSCQLKWPNSFSKVIFMKLNADLRNWLITVKNLQ